MSYDIYIGNAVLHSEWSDDYQAAEWAVESTTHPDAPFKPDLTQSGNSCHPGYSQWADAMRAVGLYELWFKPWEGLLSEHPGCKRLTREHLDAVEDARKAYSAQHPTERPGCCECAECQRPFAGKNPPPHDPTLNFNMLRLDWMAFWMRWALENCERPAVSNS